MLSKTLKSFSADLDPDCSERLTIEHDQLITCPSALLWAELIQQLLRFPKGDEVLSLPSGGMGPSAGGGR